jgi:hypothetical protein
VFVLQDERLFTAAEEEKLQNLFGFNQASLMLILNSCCYIFEQAAFSSTGPEPLYELLLEAGFDASHGKVSSCLGLLNLLVAPAPRVLFDVLMRTLSVYCSALVGFGPRRPVVLLIS